MAVNRLPVVVALLALVLTGAFDIAFSYNRPPAGKTILVSRSQDLTSVSPEQVHISQVGNDKMRISWITTDPSPSTVEYGTASGSYGFSATGTTTSYRYIAYNSGEIHDVVIGPLTPNTVYYYRCGSPSSPEFSFKTPPSQFPFKFAISGDLGQTDWTKSTLEHISKSDYDMLLLPGDLSYADTIQELWDSFGRLVSPLASERPWMVIQGNHEVEKIPILHPHSFTAYNARWRMPYEESGSNSNSYYSFDVAGGGIHVVMLGSYTDFDPTSDQYKWLQSDLKKVDRKTTPWIFVFVHAPWYNSNTAHQGEYESVQMKAFLEDLIYQARVDMVFAGHVHAYERFTRVYKEQPNNCGPVYITIGDGGNREGLATKYIDPQPNISVFREASFGHGQLEVVNGSHALWTWLRNDDHESAAAAADSIWLSALSSISSSC